MVKKKLSIFTHQCGLRHMKSRQTDVLLQYIDTGPCINLRRSFKRFLMVYDDHPRAKLYVRSFNSKRREDAYHLLHYYVMIHPLSKFALFRRFMMFFVLSGIYMMLPFLLLFTKTLNGAVFWVISFLQVLYICEMFMTFFTGYKDSRVVLRPKKVFWKYLRTYLIPDVVSILPFFAHIYLHLRRDDSQFIHDNWKLIFIMENFKIVRYIYWADSYKLMMNYFEVPKSVTAVVGFLLKLVFLFCLLFSVRHCLEPMDMTLEFDELLDVFFDNFYDMIVELLNVSHAIKEAHWDLKEKIINIIYICIGFCCLLKVLCTFWEHLHKYFASGFNETLTYQQFEAYASYTGISAELKGRIHTYLDFKYQGEYFKDNVIRDIISPNLLRETKRVVSRCRLEKVKLFCSVPEELLLELEEHLYSDIYLAGDIIIKEGTTGRYLYFIVSGTVTVTSATGEHICCLEDGANFGEIALILNQKRLTTIIAATPCELLVLKQSVYESVLNPYPRVLRCLKQEALYRLHATVGSLEGPVCRLFDPSRSETATLDFKDTAEREAFADAIAARTSIHSVKSLTKRTSNF